MTPRGNGGLRERKKLQTWRTIRTAAFELIGERGFEAVSVEEIAAAANVSRSTLFNYFPTKEAIVLDPDPEEPEVWRALLRARPGGEPLWASLREVQLGYLGSMADRLVIQKRLKAASPKLAESTREMGAQFHADVREWAHGHAPGDPVATTLMVNTAFSALSTAYALWSPEDGFERLRAVAQECFDRVGKGFDAG
ncbi:TetR family transcriptional regulator [Lentzea sp. CA-135723]|uniref:TetR family transcriptional regulator n=1 Tax=Lentzea sp. CA-135723 TaxID=3239950 RepID=UPI003D8CD52A